MRKSQVRILLAISLTLILAHPFLWGQSGGQTSSAQVKAIYGSAVGYPGSPVELSFYLTAPDMVGSLVSEIYLPKKLITFDNVRSSNILEADAQVSMETKVEDDPQDASRSVLKVSIKNSQSEKKPIPTGLLAFVIFKISADAVPGDLKLDHKASALDAAEAKPIAGTTAESPVISVYPKGINPLLTCFFFSH